MLETPTTRGGDYDECHWLPSDSDLAGFCETVRAHTEKVDAAGHLLACSLVEATGIEPLLPVNLNLIMVHDFGSYCVNIFGQHRYLSSGVLPSLGDAVIT